MSTEPGGTRSGLLSRLTVAPLGSHILEIYEDEAFLNRTVAELQQRAAAACTERDQLRQALERIQELDRLRKEFVAMLVHDIRGPLAVAAGYLDLLRSKRDTLGPEKLDQFVANGLEAAARIERLVDDMLAASSLEAMEFTYELRLFDLGEVVRATVGQFCQATGADVDVIVAPSLPSVLADHARQTQIMENLLTNAVRCSPPCSPVRVVVGRVPEGVRVSVIDRGAGFDASDATKLFSPFDGIGRGGAPGTYRPGPGLWLAKSLVEGQGGTISASSVRGHGSTFTYTVPAPPG